MAGPGGCLLVCLGSTCWLVSDSPVLSPAPSWNSEVAVACGACPPLVDWVAQIRAAGKASQGLGEQVAVTGCTALREAGLG